MIWIVPHSNISPSPHLALGNVFHSAEGVSHGHPALSVGVTNPHPHAGPAGDDLVRHVTLAAHAVADHAQGPSHLQEMSQQVAGNVTAKSYKKIPFYFKKGSSKKFPMSVAPMSR